METGAIGFSLPENLPTQPADVPVLVREFDAAGTGGAVVLNDDLVVLTEPGPGPLGSARGVRIGAAVHSVLCSDAAACLPDVNGDGLLTPADFNAWISNFNDGC